MFGLRKRTWIIGGVVAALLGTAAFATSRYHGMTPEERAAMATDRISERLDLDESQAEAFGKVAARYMEMRGATPEFMIDLSGKLSELARDETLTVEEVNVLREEIKAEFDRRADELIPEFVAFYNTLDASQRDMVAARMDRMRERMEKGEMHAMRHGYHGGYKGGHGGRGEGEYRKGGRHQDGEGYMRRDRMQQGGTMQPETEEPSATE